MRKTNVTHRQHKIPSPEMLSNVALFYLSRFVASEEALRKVLKNRVRRAAMTNPDFEQDKAAQSMLYETIERIIGQYKRNGVINDAEFARIKTNSMRRSGRGSAAISQRLRKKGVSADVVTETLSQEDSSSDMEAAMIFAKKRRLGAGKKQQLTAAQKRKEFAAFARAGFSYDIARKILGGDMDDYEDLT